MQDSDDLFTRQQRERRHRLGVVTAERDAKAVVLPAQVFDLVHQADDDARRCWRGRAAYAMWTVSPSSEAIRGLGRARQRTGAAVFGGHRSSRSATRTTSLWPDASIK